MTDNIEKNRKTVTNIYAALIASVVMQFIPNASVQLFAMLVFLGVFVWCYIARKQFGHATLVENHTTYIIRTIWIFSLGMTIGFILCGIWLYQAADQESLQIFADEVTKAAASESPPDLTNAYVAMVNANFSVIIWASLITVGPSFIYLGYRLIKGARRGVKGYRIDHPASWL